MSDFDFDMDFGGDEDGFDPDKAGSGGMVDEGSYCFLVTGVDPHTEKTGDMDIELEVVSGTVPSQVGRKHHEYLKYPDPSVPPGGNAARKEMIFLSLVAMGLTTPAELKANKNRFTGDLALAIGRMVCGKITHIHFDKKDGSKGCKAMLFPDNGPHKYEKNFWSANSPKAAGIPMPAGTVAGEAGSTNGNGTNGNAAAAAGSFADDPLAGLVD